MVTAAGTTCMVAAMPGAGGGRVGEGVDFCTVNLQLPFLEIRREIGRATIFSAYIPLL